MSGPVRLHTEYPEKGQPVRRDLHLGIRYDPINLKDDPFNFCCKMRLDDYSDTHWIAKRALRPAWFQSYTVESIL